MGIIIIILLWTVCILGIVLYFTKDSLDFWAKQAKEYKNISEEILDVNKELITSYEKQLTKKEELIGIYQSIISGKDELIELYEKSAKRKASPDPEKVCPKCGQTNHKNSAMCWSCYARLID